MAGHPFREHRQHKVEKERVAHIAHGHRHRADGGRVHSDEKEDRKLIKEMIHEHAEGKKAKHRRDRIMRAKGGRVGKKGHTKVNVVVNAGQHQPMPVPMPPPPMAAPPGPPPGLGVPPPGLGAGPPGMPPGGPMLPPRKHGGRIESPKNMKPYHKGGKMKRADGGFTESDAAKRLREANAAQPWYSGSNMSARKAAGDDFVKSIKNPERARGGKIFSDGKTAKEPSAKALRAERARGGSVKSGPAWEEGRKSGTQVQHSPALSVTEKNMNRGKPITFKSGGKVKSFMAYASGGKVEAPQNVDPATDRIGGGGGGLGRREKIKKYAVGKPMKEVDGAR